MHTRLRIQASASPRQVKIDRVRSKLYKAIGYAYSVCHKDKNPDLCGVAWGEVEELSRALYKLRTEQETMQSRTCRRDPGHPECREYDL